MDATGTYAFPFPELSDAPNTAAHIEALAEAVEAKFEANDAALPRGIKAIKRSTGNGTPVTAETLQLSVTFTAEANRTYMCRASGGTVDGAAAAAVHAGVLNIRYAAGGTVTTAGTGIARTQVAVPSSGSSNEEGSIPGFEGPIVGAAAGSVTVGVFLSSSTADVVGLFSTSVAGLTLVVEDAGPTVTVQTAALP